MSTSRPVTFGESAEEVIIWPNTIHGCRPISVKIHPTDNPPKGRGNAPARPPPYPPIAGHPTLPGEPQPHRGDKNVQRAEADHPTERPVCDPQHRGVVTGTKGLRVLGLQLVNALHAPVECFC